MGGSEVVTHKEVSGGPIDAPVAESPPVPRPTFEIEVRREGAYMIIQKTTDDFLDQEQCASL